MDDIIKAHEACTSNGAMLATPQTCGCFYCCRTFDSQEIEEWIDDRRGPTALCPYCGIDSVIGEQAGYPLTPQFLEAMYHHWFT